MATCTVAGSRGDLASILAAKPAGPMRPPHMLRHAPSCSPPRKPSVISLASPVAGSTATTAEERLPGPEIRRGCSAEQPGEEVGMFGAIRQGV